MADLLIIAAPLLTLALLYCGWRAQHIFRRWCPAAATVWRSDYSELEQFSDRWTPRQADPDGGLGWSARSDTRAVNEVVVFTDADGNRRRASVERYVARGWRPDGVFTIWYDPADPQRVTAFGPAGWLGSALAMAAALAWLFLSGGSVTGL